MYAILIKNDGKEWHDDLWGPYLTEERAKEIIDAYVAVPESAQVVPATPDMKTKYTGCPY